MEIIIRQEKPEDYEAVYEVVKLAFAGAEHTNGDEQNLVDRLRESDAFIPELSLVAVTDEKIVGHILLTKGMIADQVILALAPVAVLPEYQKQGIGSRLIEEGHKRARKLGYGAVILVGHPAYYPRFGYEPVVGKWNIKAPFQVPAECFMALELKPEALQGISGVLEHAKEFLLD